VNRLLLPLAALLLACPADDDDSAPPQPPDPPRLVVTGNVDGEQALDFGQAAVGTSATLELTLANVGGGELLLAGPAFSGTPGFALGNPEGWPSVIEAGRSASAWVAWEPAWDGQALGQMRFEAADGEVIEVALRGDGVGPRLEWAPEVLDFGDVDLFCAAVGGELYLANTGRSPLTIEGASLEVLADPAEIVLQTDLEATTLQPEDVLPLSLSFAPTVIGQQLGLLTVLSDDPVRPELQLEIRGTGRQPQTQTDVFEAGRQQAIDILWAIDNSGSLSDVYAVLAASVDQWFDDQLASGLLEDWHLGVVTTDIGDQGHLQGEPRFVTPEYADGGDLFAAAANVGGGGSGIEQPFHNVLQALESAVTPGGFNEGFLRDDAALALIFVCDEAEQSPWVQGWAAEDYLAAWQALKPEPDMVVVSSVSGGLEGCSGEGLAAPGIDFVTVSEATGGLALSVCRSDWVDDFLTASWHSAGVRSHFDLSSTPVPASLVVALEGLPLTPDHWTFDAALNRVFLEEDFSPDPGAELRITYVPEGACAP